jgi:hypothetical protein
MKDNNFEEAFVWFMSGYKGTAERFLRAINFDLHAPQPPAVMRTLPLQTDGNFALLSPVAFAHEFDYTHLCVAHAVLFRLRW